MSASLARGVIAASTVMVFRVLLLTAALSAAIAIELAPFLIPSALIISGFTAIGLRNTEVSKEVMADTTQNPLRLWSAMKMAALFQTGIIAINLVSIRLGETGTYVTGALLGITDIDALTVSMTQSTAGITPRVAARVIAVGVVSATLFKAAMAFSLGAPKFRRHSLAGLLLLALACAIAIWFV
jgi:uncharacterized membrane protein (DUF4010 family)